MLDKSRIQRVEATRRWELRNAGPCPYKIIKGKGRTYPTTKGGFAMGFTYKEFCEAIGYVNTWALGTYLSKRKLPKPNIEVFKDDTQVMIYDSETARKVSEYIHYSYKKPGKLIKSYNEYIKGIKDE